jgi:GDP-D-mannose dehydratase
MYVNAKETTQKEDTAFHPRSQYGISKVAGFQLTENYRYLFGMVARRSRFFLFKNDCLGPNKTVKYLLPFSVQDIVYTG